MTGVQTCALPICFPVTIQSRNNFRDNIGSDTHWNHFATLDKLDVEWRKVNADQILNEECKAEKTAICLWLTWFTWHWVVMASANSEKKVVRCYMGNGKIGMFNEDQFRSQFWAAYEIGVNGTRSSIVDRFFSKVLRIFA